MATSRVPVIGVCRAPRARTCLVAFFFVSIRFPFHRRGTRAGSRLSGLAVRHTPAEKERERDLPVFRDKLPPPWSRTISGCEPWPPSTGGRHSRPLSSTESTVLLLPFLLLQPKIKKKKISHPLAPLTLFLRIS